MHTEGGHGIEKRGGGHGIETQTHTQLKTQTQTQTQPQTQALTGVYKGGARHSGARVKPCARLSQTHTHVSEVHDVQIHPLLHTHTRTRQKPETQSADRISNPLHHD